MVKLLGNEDKWGQDGIKTYVIPRNKSVAWLHSATFNSVAGLVKNATLTLTNLSDLQGLVIFGRHRWGFWLQSPIV